MKKFFAVLITTVLCFSLFSTSALAADETISPMRYELCDNCFNGKVVKTGTSYGSWYNTGTVRPCQHGHGPIYNDYEIARTVTSTHACTNCGIGYSTVGSETSWRCTYSN